MERVETFTIEALDESNPRRAEAMRLILAPGATPGGSAERPFGALTTYLEGHSLRIATVLGASIGQRLVSAVMLIESPGRLGAVYVPAIESDALGRQAAVTLLRRLQAESWRRSLCMVQALLETGRSHAAAVLAEAGFEFLAELCYLQRSAGDACPSCHKPAGIDFAPYAPDAECLFLEVLEQSYRRSLDCPRLSGVRRTADVLATHRATGVFDPGNWLVATLDGVPVGILLLAGVTGRATFEVVYMGVVPKARGRGIGDALLERAVDICRGQGHAALTLAVDSTNEPARRLYDRWSLREFDRRRAWFSPNPQNRPARR